MTKIRNSIIGHAIGDAMGVPTEFLARDSLKEKPVTDMIDSLSIGQPAGTWSDDTSMEIATIDSFIEKGEFDYNDIMLKWTKWLNEAEYTATNETFDVGRTCLSAIRNFNNGIEPLNCGLDSENSNGNGSLMRILPVALYSFYNKLDEKQIIKLTNEISSLTHAHDISKLGCYICVRYIMFLLEGKEKNDAYNLLKKVNYSEYSEYAISKYYRILKNNIKNYSLDDISSSGYVVDTLESVFWIFLNYNSYEEIIIASTNIGNDTDTIGAIVGSMAGIVHGYDNIPNKWLKKLRRRKYLEELCYIFEKKLTKY